MRERSVRIEQRWRDGFGLLELQVPKKSPIMPKIVGLHDEMARRYPEETAYQHHLMDQYWMRRVLGDPGYAASVLAAEDLDEELRAIIEVWHRSPARLTTFFVTADHGSNLFEIEDLFTGKREMLYSPGVKKLQQRGESRNAHYLGLLFFNGVCLQGAGLYLYNRLTKADYDFFCRAVDREAYEEGGLDGVLVAHPKSILSIFEQTQLYGISFRGVPMAMHLGTTTPTSYSFDHPYWATKQIQGDSQHILEEASGEMVGAFGEQLCLSNPGIFNMRVFELAGSWLVMAHSLDAFKILAAMVGRPGLEPHDIVHMPLVMSLDNHGYQMAWRPFSLETEKGDEGDEGESESITRLNGFMGEYTVAYNEGREVDIATMGKRWGLSQEESHDLVAQFEQMLDKYRWEVPPEEQEYELVGPWPVPSPTQLRMWGDSLVDSRLFMVLMDEASEERFNAHTQHIYAEQVEWYCVYEVVEGLFLPHLPSDQVGQLLLNLLLWIVLHKKDEPVMVRSIAVEAFKLFPFLSQSTDLDTCTQMLSDATIAALLSTSLLSVKERPRGERRRRGRYTVQATPLLTYLVTPIPHSV